MPAGAQDLHGDSGVLVEAWTAEDAGAGGEVDSIPYEQLTADQLQTAVKSHQLEVLHRCVIESDAGPPRSREIVAVAIAPDGKVSSAVATGNDPVMGHCLEGEIKGWRFPRARTNTFVNLPFHFVHPSAMGPSYVSPFDRGATARALGTVDVSDCKTAGGPTGRGHLRISFAPDGSAESVLVDQPPFAGTATGGCVAARFRNVRVPAFAGTTVTVGKSFSIE